MGIEQSRGKPSVHGASRVEVPRVGFYGGNDAALGNFDDVIAQRLRHRVQGQGAVDEALNIFEPAHGSLPVVIDDAKTLPNEGFRH
jgi:hypothetical protein